MFELRIEYSARVAMEKQSAGFHLQNHKHTLGSTLFTEIDSFAIDGLWHGPIDEKIFLSEINIRKIFGFSLFGRDTESLFVGIFDIVENRRNFLQIINSKDGADGDDNYYKCNFN